MKVLIICLLIGIASAIPAKHALPKGLEKSARKSLLLQHNMKIVDKVLKDLKKMNEAKPRYEFPPPSFTCDTTPGEEPTSVHELRPGDIDIVAAVGDSVTSGNGIDAEDVEQVNLQYRGKSFSAGGDGSLAEDILTLPNILKMFNPDLKGASHGIALSTDPEAGLNKAEPDAESRDMLTQVQTVVTAMEEGAEYDYENDWKLLTMFVGGLDLCFACEDESDPGTEFDYLANIKEALDWLHSVKQVPRMLVQVIPVFDISRAPEYVNSEICEVMQALLCPCVVDELFNPQLKPLQLEYARLVREEILSEVWETRDDFAVVYQPYTQDITMPTLGDEIIQDFASADCFHPSTLSHEGYSMMLWDNMLTPVGGKTHFINITDYVDDLVDLRCPTTENPYIFTITNSRAKNVKIPEAKVKVAAKKPKTKKAANMKTKP